MIDFREAIAKSVLNALPAAAFTKEEIKSLIEIPPESRLGDYALPCFKLCRVLKKEPNEIAAWLISKISLPKEIRDAKVAGPYINFFVNPDILSKDVIGTILKEKNNYGKNKKGKGKSVMVEYSAPNTNKPLHIGHLRNDSIGMSVSKIFENNGFKVIKANLLNDRGIHICKSMLAYRKWGKGRNPNSEKMKPDHFIGKYYSLYGEKSKENPGLEKEAQTMLLEWEQKKRNVRALWKKMNKWALQGFRQTYKSFGSEFDVLFYESDFYDKAKPLIEAGLKKGLLVKDETGAIVADLEKYNLPKKTVLRADGTAIYLTNDLALTKHKFDKYKIVQSIWVVGSEQNTYFKQLFKIFEILGFEWAERCKHLSYGMVFLPEGRLKSREGRVIDADELIEKVENLAREELKKRYKLKEKELDRRATKIGMAAIKFYMLKVEPVKDMFFDMEKAVSFEGDSGPYIQYSYARARSILRKMKGKGGSADYSKLKSKEEKELIKLLSIYPSIVEDSAEDLQPSKLCQYLLAIASAFNLFYHKFPVLKAEKSTKNARVALVEATSVVLKNGLNLLNIEALEEM